MNEVAVHIRDINEVDAVYLTEWRADKLDQLIRIVSSWGVYTGEDVTTEAVGQFVVVDGRAFFEIIVGSGE